MIQYRVNRDEVRLPEGVLVRLSEEQVARRHAFLELVEGMTYRVMAPVGFKRGEEFATDHRFDTRVAQALVEPLDDITPAESPELDDVLVERVIQVLPLVPETQRVKRTGAPKLAYVRELAGDDITREALTEALRRAG